MKGHCNQYLIKNTTILPFQNYLGANWSFRFFIENFGRSAFFIENLSFFIFS